MAVDMIIDALVLITSPNVCETCPGLEVSDVGGGVGDVGTQLSCGYKAL